MKNVRSSQPCISINFCTESSSSMWVSLTKRRFLISSFFTSQLSYCPFIWVCHSRTFNKKINKLNERCLRIIYNDKKLSFKELSETDKSVPIHIKNLQVLATERFKVYTIYLSLSWDNYSNQGITITIYKFSQFELSNCESSK